MAAFAGELDALSGVVTVQSGVVLQQLEEHLAPHGFLVPLDLGARGSCQLGGNASTAAGGARFTRFGSLRSNIVGLEAVKADGTVLDMLTAMRKDNTGVDLKQLVSNRTPAATRPTQPTRATRYMWS